jgi:hypothetical protein
MELPWMSDVPPILIIVRPTSYGFSGVWESKALSGEASAGLNTWGYYSRLRRHARQFTGTTQ